MFSRPASADDDNDVSDAASWTHHGRALGPGLEGDFDAGGVATPSAAVVVSSGRSRGKLNSHEVVLFTAAAATAYRL